jgi:hypothetical protein
LQKPAARRERGRESTKKVLGGRERCFSRQSSCVFFHFEMYFLLCFSFISSGTSPLIRDVFSFHSKRISPLVRGVFDFQFENCVPLTREVFSITLRASVFDFEMHFVLYYDGCLYLFRKVVLLEFDMCFLFYFGMYLSFAESTCTKIRVSRS